MRNPAASSEDKIGISSILSIVSAFVMAGLVLVNGVYFAQTRERVGIVQSVGSVDVGVGSLGRGGGNREYASITLQDGSTVLARVSGNLLTTGETVTVLEQQRFVGPAVFQVVAIEPGH